LLFATHLSTFKMLEKFICTTYIIIVFKMFSKSED